MYATMTQYEMAAELEEPQSNINLWLAECGIAARPHARLSPPLEDLAAVYLPDGHTIYTVAEHFDVSSATASRWVREAGLKKPRARKPPPEPKRRPKPTEQEVRELYEAGHTQPEVAKLLGVSLSTLVKLMNEYEIERRPRGTRGFADR